MSTVHQEARKETLLAVLHHVRMEVLALAEVQVQVAAMVAEGHVQVAEVAEGDMLTPDEFLLIGK
jgi:hypothetical protein